MTRPVPIRTTALEQGILMRASGQAMTADGWFGPGQPMAPSAPDEVKGRARDYGYSANLLFTPRSEPGDDSVDFPTLRRLADPTQGGWDMVRLAIQTAKNRMLAQKWVIRRKDGTKKKDDPEIKRLTALLARPDGRRKLTRWINLVLEDHYTIDHPCIYLKPTTKKGIFVPEVVDGATIKLLIGQDGRMPGPGEAAFQQKLKGMPAVDYAFEEMIWAPYNEVPQRSYAMGPVEQFVGIISLALKRHLTQLHHYTEGNIPEAMIGCPLDWQPDQVKEFQEYMDSILSGNSAARSHMTAIPGGMTPIFTRDPKLKDEQDEWFARILCWTFNLPVSALVKDNNRATTKTNKETAQEEGLEPEKIWLKDLMDEVIERAWNAPDYECASQDEEITDPLVKAQVFQIALGGPGKPWMTPDEVREKAYGMPTLTQEQKDKMNPPAPEPLPLPGNASEKQGQDKQPASTDKQPKEAGPAKKVEKLEKAKRTVKPIRRDRPSVMKLQAKIQKTVASFFKAQIRPIAEQLHAVLPEDTEKLEKMSRKEAKQILESLNIDWRELGEDLEPFLLAIAQDGGAQGLAQVGAKTTADLLDQVNEKAVAWAEAHAAKLITQIEETTRKSIQGDIATSIELGMSVDQIADVLAADYGFSKDRAELIATTERAFADVAGNMIAYRESGVVAGKHWILGSEHEDGQDCECETNADAGMIGLDEDFPSGDDAAPSHPRCACDVIPDLVDEVDE